LLIANIAWVAAKKLNLSFTLLLVAIGLLMTIVQPYVPWMGTAQFSPELLFYVFLPILLFESSYQLDFRKLAKDATFVNLLATVGIVISAFIVGALMVSIFQLPFIFSFLFASIISSTDPVAVISLFKDLGVSKRLVRLVDSESMFNDASSVVLAKLFLSIALVGMTTSSVIAGALNFVYIIVVSVAFGCGIAFVSSKLLHYIENELAIELTVSVMLALASFLIAEHVLSGSGIISVVSSGLFLGNYGKLSISPQIKSVFHEFWSYLAFIANSIVFLLIGLNFSFSFFWDNIGLLFGLYALVQLGRMSAVYGLGLLHNLFNKAGAVKLEMLHVIQWGGLRGALPIAVSLSVANLMPPGIALETVFPASQWELLFNYTVGVVIISLFINGSTIEYLVRALGLNQLKPLAKVETSVMKMYILKKAFSRVNSLEKLAGPTSSLTDLVKEFDKEYQVGMQELQQVVKHDSELVKQVLYITAFQFEKEIFHKLLAKKIISPKVYSRLERKLLEGVDLIEEGVMPVDFKSHQRMQKIIAYSKKDLSKQELYFYRKAREFGNLEVIEQLDIFKDIEFMKPIVSEVTEQYMNFYHKNKVTCKLLENECKEYWVNFEASLYRYEFKATEEFILKELEAEGCVSEPASKFLRSCLLSV
jgi:CPA1 family monovalent cation:H+ antiporter